MSKSIMQHCEEPQCYITGSRINLDKHHCVHGRANRKIAEKYGLWVYLRHDIHMNLHDKDKELDRELEQDAQRAFEKEHSREEWMKLIGKNYL
jgi:hypothetical protein